MKFENNPYKFLIDEAIEKQKDFKKLPDEKKKDVVEADHKQALEMKDRVDNYVSVEKIIPEIKIDNIFHSSEYYKNKKMDNYGQLQDYLKTIGNDYETLYNDVLPSLINDIEENNGTEFNKIKKMFSNIPLVDLGAGQSQNGYFTAKILGSSGYIGVEPYFNLSLEDSLTAGEDSRSRPIGSRGLKFRKNTGAIHPITENIKNIPFAIAAEDALTFLKRLPNHSVGILSCGVDGHVMSGRSGTPEEHEKIKKYIKDVNNEIIRVLHPASAIIHNGSVFDGRNETGDSELEITNMKLDKTRQFFISRPKPAE